MSLQVWMPMINDLKNQGVNSAEPIVYGNIVTESEGKIGKCHTSLGNAYIDSRYGKGVPITNLTICCWFKFKDKIQDRKMVFGTLNSDFDRCYLGYIDDNWSFGFGDKSWRENNSKISASLNTWQHLAIVIKDYTMTLFIDGEEINAYTTKDILNMPKNIYIFDGNNNLSYPISGSMNDFRIYDNPLSPKEIKELAKGLVLHLPLNQPNRNKNLLPNSLGPFTGIYPNDSTASYKDFKSFSFAVTPEANETITVSFDAKAERDNASLVLYLHNNLSGRQVAKGISNKGISSVNPDGHINILMTNYFSHYWVQYTFNSTTPALGKHLLFRIFPEYKGLEYVVKNVKLERGKNDYPVYTFPDDDALIEYDTSGYGYNGTAAIDLVPIGSDDSPRYRESIKFDTASKRIKISNFNPSGFSDSFSVCWWERCSDYSGYWMPWCAIKDVDNGIAGLNLHYSGGFIFNNTYDGSGNPFKNGANKVQVPPENEWTFLTLTGDGKESKLYINGQYAGTATFKPLKSTIINLNGDLSSYSKENLELSDFRIYSTVLSDEDILELYNTSLIVNDNGSIMNYELIEE